MIRKICIITATRAEYGILKGLLNAISVDPTLTLQLIVTGSHLDDRRGHTVDYIIEDGFNIDGRIDIVEADDSGVATARAAGRCLSDMAAALDELAPDLVVLVGDRYEALAIAQACMLLAIPLAHIHGGEVTEGAMDDSMRHAITKLAQVHLVAAEPYRSRVIQMGELPERVFTVGAPGLDNVQGRDVADIAALERHVGIPLSQGFFVFTYHPETRGQTEITRLERALVSAFDAFPAHAVIVTGVNTDPGRDEISDMLSRIVSDRSGRMVMIESLGQDRYLDAVVCAAAVIGNSSSGIIEAPALGTPTVNIGDRQRGRLKAASIVDCEPSPAGVTEAIGKCLDPTFLEAIEDQICPYGAGGASARILDVLRSLDVSSLIRKPFVDLAVERAKS